MSYARDKSVKHMAHSVQTHAHELLSCSAFQWLYCTDLGKLTVSAEERSSHTRGALA